MNELSIHCNDKKFSILSMKLNIDIFFRVIYTGYWYIFIRYLPRHELDIMHIRNIVRLVIIYVIRRYFVVFLLFSIILLGIIRKLYAGEVNNRVYTKAAKKGDLMPFSNIGFRLSGFISGIIPIIPRISKDSIIIVYIIKFFF